MRYLNLNTNIATNSKGFKCIKEVGLKLVPIVDTSCSISVILFSMIVNVFITVHLYTLIRIFTSI